VSALWAPAAPGGAGAGAHVVGLVGEYRFARPTFYCATCHACQAPLDGVLGLGDCQLSPGLAEVVCEQAQKDSFAGASRSVLGSVGVAVPEETVRRTAAAVGGLIEQDQADRTAWQVADADVPACLLVELDGVQHAPARRLPRDEGGPSGRP